MKALDLSYGCTQVTPEWCQAQLAADHRLLICDLWTGAEGFPEAERALRYWREAGGITGGYLVIHKWRPLAEHYKGAKKSAGSEWDALSFVAVDIEDVTGGVSPLAGQCTIHMIVDALTLLSLERKRGCIYTSGLYWRGIVHDSPDCSQQPLWEANYTGMPDLERIPGFGNWTLRTGHQYKGPTLIDGVPCDLSEFRDDFLAGDEGMTPAQEAEIKEIIGPVRGWAALRKARAEAAAAFGFGLTDSLDAREAEEMASYASRLEALLTPPAG